VAGRNGCMLEVCNEETAAQRNDTRGQQHERGSRHTTGRDEGGTNTTAPYNSGDGGEQQHSSAATAATASIAHKHECGEHQTARGWSMDRVGGDMIAAKQVVRNRAGAPRKYGVAVGAMCSVAVELRLSGFSLRGGHTRASDSPLQTKKRQETTEAQENNRGTPVLHVHPWITRFPRQTHRVGVRTLGTVPDRIGVAVTQERTCARPVRAR